MVIYVKLLIENLILQSKIKVHAHKTSEKKLHFYEKKMHTGITKMERRNKTEKRRHNGKTIHLK